MPPIITDGVCVDGLHPRIRTVDVFLEEDATSEGSQSIELMFIHLMYPVRANFSPRIPFAPTKVPSKRLGRYVGAIRRFWLFLDG